MFIGIFHIERNLHKLGKLISDDKVLHIQLSVDKTSQSNVQHATYTQEHKCSDSTSMQKFRRM